GGDGDDSFNVRLVPGSTALVNALVMLDGGAGADVLTLQLDRGPGPGNSPGLNSTFTASISGGDGNDQISVSGAHSAFPSIFASVTVDAGAGDDTVSVNHAAVATIDLGAGDDALNIVASAGQTV